MFWMLDVHYLYGDEIVDKPDFAILNQIAGLAGHFGKGYCYPSQDEICRRVTVHHGRRISRRTVNRHLLTFELMGFIKRVRRHRATPRGMEFRSTLYTLTRKTLRLLGGIFKAAAQAVSFFGKSRVPVLAQNKPLRGRITPAGAAKSGGSPPGEDRKPPSGADWGMRKAKSQPHVANLKKLLA